MAWRVRTLVDVMQMETGAVLDPFNRVHVMEMADRPLFGPSIMRRPGPLQGWFDLWNEAERIRPVLIVIDPVLSAFAGDATEATSVGEFLIKLGLKAGAIGKGAGVLVVAHSTKTVRKDANDLNPFDSGQVAGTTYWTDAVRGVLTMTWRVGGEADERMLSIAKANYGPSRIVTAIDPIRSCSNAIVGFK